MTDPRSTDPRLDPNVPRPGAPYSDPAADPLINDRPIPADRGRGGLIAAGVIAVLLVIALIAFNTGPSTDPGTTAVIPEQSEQAPANDAPSATPTTPDATAPAPAPATPAPAPEAAPAPSEPAAPAPAPAQ